ncbi:MULTISPECIES: nitrilase-related carbon-nitrogen hydrolase [unclassified Halobacteriovorax]|uniref:nitrilase-related carbon-nitrogen hydrolase n=1 Tax=unclassified Halobacteriovorax TaxID=2639665 RepID=UPI00399A6439
MNELVIANIQISSSLDYQSNLKKIKKYLSQAKEAGAQVAFLPECFYSISNGRMPSPYLVEWDNEHFDNIRQLAIDSGLFLAGGSVAFKSNTAIYNKAINLDPKGCVIGSYDKCHLFSCDITTVDEQGNEIHKKVNEADIYTAGNDPLIIDILGWKIGIAICFDLRYPNFLQYYYDNKVDLITFASAFTVPTGKAHWHTLLRARSIEGQCYVVASAQSGENNPGIHTYGHSLVINPWGEILSDQKNEEGVSIVRLKKEQILEARSRVIL